MSHSPTIGGQSQARKRQEKLIRLTPDFFMKWDDFVMSHPLGSIYHLSGWKKVLEESFKHVKGEIIALRNELSGEIVAGLPVYFVNSRITGKRFVSAPFTNFCDPLANDPEDAKKLFDHLVGIYRQRNPSYIEVRARPGNHLCCDINFSTSANYLHHFLPLDFPPEILFKEFHKKAVRTPILKAPKNNLSIRSAETENDILDFYRIYRKARKRIGLPSIPYRFFQELWEVFQPAGRLQLIMCVLNRKVIGASILLKFKEWVFIEYGHDLIEYRKLCVNHFLDWEAIKLAFQEEYKFLSFGRTSLNNNGLIQYKSHWGTTAEHLVTHWCPEKRSSADSSKEVSWQYRLTRLMCNVSPCTIYDAISASVYRHMG